MILYLLLIIIIPLFSYLVAKWLQVKHPVHSSLFSTGVIIILLLLPISLFIPDNFRLQLSQPVLDKIIELNHSSSSYILTKQVLSTLMYIWAVGAILLVLRFFIRLIKMARWTWRSEKSIDAKWTQHLHKCSSLLNLKSIPPLALSSDISSPMITGVVYPHILLPIDAENWNTEMIEHTLLHELGHLKRRDLLTYFLAQMTCIIYWFNPVIWLFNRNLMLQCEFACDSFVIRQGANVKSYVLAMCDIAESNVSAPISNALALPMAEKNQLKCRVQTLQNEQGKGKRIPIILLVIILAITLPVFIINYTSVEQRELNKIDAELRLSASPFPGN